MAAVAEIQVLITVEFPEPLLQRFRAVSPRLELRVFPTRQAADIPPERLRETEVLYTAWAVPDPEQAPNLRWVQFHYAGIDHALEHSLLRSEVAVTTLSGAATPQMAEYALAMMLALSRKLPLMLQDKAAKQWAKDRFSRFQPRELRDSTVGIVGYGSIGREIARLCRAFGSSVLATKRELKQLEDPGYSMEGLGDSEANLVDRLYPPQAVGSMASECDFLIIAVPLTPDTRGMINGAVLARMKPSAYLVDISRGEIVDHSALLEALNSGKLAGAALDVYPVEPVPEVSPLWEHPNLILSPHVAGASQYYLERAADLFAENLRRYLVNEPLLNRFDAKRGY